MGEGMELSNGSWSRDEQETTVIINTGASETEAPVKPPPFNWLRLRNLAIASTICGCSCIGIAAVIYAVKANEKQKAHSNELAAYWAKKSRKTAFLSIGIFVSLLILVPSLVVLISYVISVSDL